MSDPVRAVAAMPVLRTFALAAAAPATTDPDTPETRFLSQQRDLAGAEDWPARLMSYFERPSAADGRLLMLAQRLGLNVTEALAVALAAGAEEDAMVGRSLSWLQAPVGGSRPTLGLLASALAPLVASPSAVLDLLLTGAAHRTGLLQVASENLPVPERSLIVPLPLCLALRGSAADWPGATRLGSPTISLPPSFQKVVEGHAKALRTQPDSTLVIRTGSREEGLSLASLLAHALEKAPILVETDKLSGFGPFLLAGQMIPVWRVEMGPGERKTLPNIAGYAGPVIVTALPDGQIENGRGAVLNWPVSVPERCERADLWTNSLGNSSAAGTLAESYRHGAGRIAELSRIAKYRAGMSGRSAPALEDVIEVSRSVDTAGLDSLAQPVRDNIPDGALVVPAQLRAELESLLLRCRNRDGLEVGLGASAVSRYRPGVRALFTGPSGTGKTLAAAWLATRLGLPLYRVDLASVTSKYIGETEKNLAQLLARAEQAEVVLLFDEADSLFAKRTEVREANDRFANSQTNYLLQRIESFDGITILTSNSRARFDSAFSRRLDLILEFGLPGPEERRALWESHLGRSHELAPEELNQIAATADLSGGHIRNAVFLAATLANSQKRPIRMSDVIAGIAVEYRKLGRQVPAGWQRSNAGL